MSRGLEAVYKLLEINGRKVVYGYSGDHFSFPYDEVLARSYDGRIEIALEVFEKNVWDSSPHLSEKIKVLKNCRYAKLTSFGMDFFALKTISVILLQYQKNKELPKDGHWVI